MSNSLTLLPSLQETYEAKRKEFLTDLQGKEEEMRQMFVNKVKEAEAELKEKEKEVRREVSAPPPFEKFPRGLACLTFSPASSSTSVLSSSSGCTRRKRRPWRRKDGSWKRR